MPEPAPPGCLPYKKLSWSDFPLRNGSIDPAEQAKTLGRITFRYRHEWREVRRGYFEAKITELTLATFFDQKSSWRRARLPENAVALLAHEQGHLDLTLLLQKRLSQTRLESLEIGKGSRSEDAVTDLDGKMRQWFDAQIADNQKLQDRYDAETDHSRRRSAQERWTQQIALALRQSPPS